MPSFVFLPLAATFSCFIIFSQGTLSVPISSVDTSLTQWGPSCGILVDSCLDAAKNANLNQTWSVPSCVIAATCSGPSQLLATMCSETWRCPQLTYQASIDIPNVYASIVSSCTSQPTLCPMTLEFDGDMELGLGIHGSSCPVDPIVVMPPYHTRNSMPGSITAVRPHSTSRSSSESGRVSKSRERVSTTKSRGSASRSARKTTNSGHTTLTSIGGVPGPSRSILASDSATHQRHTSAPASAATTSITTVIFIPGSNPVAPSNASLETIQAPGATTVLSIPANTTVIALGSPSIFNTTVASTRVESRSQGRITVVSTATSAVTSVLAVTVGPGGGVVGSIPTSVSQPGFIIPTFNTNPLPPPGATQLLSAFLFSRDQPANQPIRTFTGTSGYSTVIPVPTSTTTVLIGALFGLGPFVLGAGGTIVGSLPLGISEVGGLVPVAAPGPGETTLDTASPTRTHSDGTESASQRSSSASSASSAASCVAPTATGCDNICFGPSGVPDDMLPDLDANDAPTVLSRNFFRSRNHSKSRRGVRAEHVFEFQIFTEFLKAYMANNPKQITGCNWYRFPDPSNCSQREVLYYRLKRFYETGVAENIVNRIDNTANLVFAAELINQAKLYVISKRVKSVGKTNMNTGFDPNNLASTDSRNARSKLEGWIRGFGNFPSYLNSNAALFKNTAQDIITLLQKFDLKTGSVTNPPMAVQFYQYLQSSVEDFEANAQAMGYALAAEYLSRMAKYNLICSTIDINTVMTNMLKANFPPINTNALLPDQPLCFPKGSVGIIHFDQLQDGTSPMILSRVQADGDNIKVDTSIDDHIAVLVPLPPSWDKCRNVQAVIMSKKIAPGVSPLFNLDCNTRALSLSVGGSVLGCGVDFMPSGDKVWYCAASSSDLDACEAQRIQRKNDPNRKLVRTPISWQPRKG
ncbi:hypothetical protein B0H10DRAFT_2191691 [Mycena sp. CBHHK59/15]|nr:hypothetical protein B0H10DRAFT_2191691 [Mycena sp. CBHHK59/15]